MLFNLGAIGYFKYYDFFITNINSLFKTDISLLNLLLPLGISFFTFQQLSFVIDTYRKVSLKYDFLSYCLFVTFFPQLIAGPIVLPSEVLPQFESHNNKSLNYDNLAKGVFMFIIGLGKKVLIADTISTFANVGFAKESITMSEAWLSSFSYTFQLYFDFSGYCDMAMGIALMFNIVLHLNFNSPYKATNIQDFWKRWHITLSRFLTNYLYIPLGGNRLGEWKTLRNLLIVFLVSGIWHGAGWNFIIWGALHGAALLVHRFWKKSGGRFPKYIGMLITFNFVNIFWVFFNSKTIDDAHRLLLAMFDFSNNYLGFTREFKKMLVERQLAYKVLAVAIIISFFCNNCQQLGQNFKPNWKTLLFTTVVFLIVLFHINRASTFLYFNF